MMQGFQHAGFEVVAAATPHRVAVDDGGACTTYGELDARANQLAHQLLALGCAPGSRVCVLTEKNVHQYTAVLGALKAGGCWVPLSTAFPLERIGVLLEMLTPIAIVMDVETASLADAIRALHPTLPIIVAGADAVPDVLDTRRPDIRHVTPDDLCYIIFTSGSTGTPKGVMVRHRSSREFLDRCPDLFGIADGARFAHFSELTFDPSILDLFHCWDRGGTLVPFNRRSWRINPLLFLRERTVNVLFTVPGVLAAIHEAGGIADPALDAVTHLLLTGEALRPAHVRAWYDAHPGSTVFNLYGTTETAIISHCFRIPRDLAPDVPVPVGRPLDGLRVRLLDGDAEVPRGDPGESVVTGSQLAAGYWASPYQTGQAFEPDPSDPRLPSVRYRTGDLLREDDDGVHWYVGRLDHQVKVRGHRVEPAEVEQALLSTTDVLEAGVVHAEWNGTGCLVAFVRTDGSVSGAELRARLQRQLPAWMVPFRILPSIGPLPTGRTGKLDRDALGRMAAAALSREVSSG